MEAKATRCHVLMVFVLFIFLQLAGCIILLKEAMNGLQQTLGGGTGQSDIHVNARNQAPANKQ